MRKLYAKYEILSAYLDGELSAGEAKELEEKKQNPRSSAQSAVLP